MSRSAPSHSRLAHALLLLVAFVWGATFVLVKSALDDASPLLFNLLRMAIATAALIAVNYRQLRSVSGAHLKAGLLAGLFLAAGYQFQTFGLSLTTPAKSAFITGMVVVFVPAFTLIPALCSPGTPRPGALTALGAVTAFAGLIFLTTPGGTTLRTLFVSIGKGDLLSLCCAIAFAAHLLTLARCAPGIPSSLFATLQIAACTLYMLLSLPLEHPHARFSPRLLIALLVCGLFATAAAFTIQSYAQQHLPPTHTVVLLALEPVFAWLTSLLILHESLGGRSLLGAALIFAGIAIIEFLPAAHSTEIPA
jgi:drug/metabolite transporter (DMT)-like permease